MSNDAANKSEQGRERETYVAPMLRVLGDVRQLTLGGSVGVGDSGNPGQQENPPEIDEQDPIWR
jgi:hypothetical protein